MKNFRLLVLGVMALSVASCGGRAVVSGKIENAVKDTVVAARLDINVFSVIDTIVTKADGSMSLKVDVKKGQPEFVYLYRKGVKIASFLLAAGDRAVFTADTLGNYSVSGSAESEKLQQVESSFAGFVKKMDSTVDSKELSKYYVEYYRSCVKYILENPFSLTVIPVLYGQLGEYAKVFNNPTDVVYFRAACDSLKTRYPESAYVKALESETSRRENMLSLVRRIESAEPVNFPDIVLPDIKGEKVALSSVKEKAVILHFWDASDAKQKMFALEVLKPLYEQYHRRGLEIYSVCLSPDKVTWADVVRGQGLEWINVCDGTVSAGGSVVNYNITELPSSILIENGDICTKEMTGVAALKKELDRIL